MEETKLKNIFMNVFGCAINDVLLKQPYYEGLRVFLDVSKKQIYEIEFYEFDYNFALFSLEETLDNLVGSGDDEVCLIIFDDTFDYTSNPKKPQFLFPEYRKKFLNALKQRLVYLIFDYFY